MSSYSYQYNTATVGTTSQVGTMCAVSWNYESNGFRSEMAANAIVSFEVFGKVQGVYFRKHTQAKARELGLTGWVQNTRTGACLTKRSNSLAQICAGAHFH